MRFDGGVVVAGLGSIGERHVRNLVAAGQRVSVLRRRGARPPRTLTPAQFVAVTDIEEALDREPSALIIATPTSLHRDLLAAAVDRRIPTLVEVPLTHDPEGFDAIRKSAAENGTPILIGYNIRFHPALRAIRAALFEEAIGRPLYSRMQFGEYLPDCHPWEDYRQRYEARSDLGGGAILTSSHEIDHAQWLFGPVRYVTCVARTTALDTDVEDVAMMILEHEEGVLSEVELDFVQRVYRRSLQVAGTEGTIEWELLSDQVRIFRSSTGQWETLLRLEAFDFNRTYIDELEHLSDVVRGAAQPLIPLADGLHAVQVAITARNASIQHCRLAVPFDRDASSVHVLAESDNFPGRS